MEPYTLGWVLLMPLNFSNFSKLVTIAKYKLRLNLFHSTFNNHHNNIIILLLLLAVMKKTIDLLRLLAAVIKIGISTKVITQVTFLISVQ